MEYIDGKKENGILYDWKKIRKEYKKLKCPKQFYNPCCNNLENDYYFMDLSERSIGKTTSWLLLGLCMNKLYGTKVQYIRQRDDMIVNKNISNMFDTILKHDYISKITDGEYNYIEYSKRGWYYVKLDSEGMIEKKDTTEVVKCLSIQNSEIYKSSYNAPTGDLIIFDEFSSKTYQPDEFIYFLDLLKTIQRDRQSVKVALLANTIDIHCQYFHEFEVFDDVSTMEVGEYRRVTTDGGTNISLRILSPDKVLKENKSISNKLYYGFKNPKLNAITGGGWSIKDCQRIDRTLDFDVIFNRFYIYRNNKYLKLDVVNTEIGICIYCHWASVTYDDSIIFTLDEIRDKRYIAKMGCGQLLKFFQKMYYMNRFYYASNDCASFIENYLKSCKLISNFT